MTDASERRRTLAAAFTYFVVAGVATVMLGPTLPALAARWNVPDAQLGTLFVASFIGQLCGAWFAVRRLGASLAFGAGITAAGCAGLAFAGFAAAHVALFCVGMGLGFGLTAGNVIVGTLRVESLTSKTSGASSQSKLLAVLNMCWGVGAIASPVLIHTSMQISRQVTNRVTGLQMFFLALAAALACSAVLTIILLSRVPRFSTESIAGSSGSLQPRLFIFFLAILLTYVGVENSLGGWLPTHAHRTLGSRAGADVASLIALCFWVGELSGRAVTTLLLNVISERLLYRTCLVVLIAAMGAICFVQTLNVTTFFALVAIAAISLAPLYPLSVAFLLARAGSQPRLGPLFALSALGGAALPWFTGVVSTHFHALRIGLIVPAMGALLLFLLSVYLPRSSRPVVTSSP